MEKMSFKKIMPALLALAAGAFLLFISLAGENTSSPVSDADEANAENAAALADTITDAEQNCVVGEAEENSSQEAVSGDISQGQENPVCEENAEMGAEEEPEFYFEAPPVTDYEDTVYAGSVRYVNQWQNPRGNGWGKYYYISSSECTTACISMCLSYLGLDASPEKLLDYSRTTYFKSDYGFKEQLEYSDLTAPSILPAEGRTVLEEMFLRYSVASESDVSPVMLYVKGNGHTHALVVLGREAEDIFLVLDPTERGMHRICINEEGLITTEEEQYFVRYTDNGKKSAQICGLAQWQLKST